MRNIPPELLVDIFELSTLSSSSQSRTPNRDNQLQSLCLVSKEWNEIAKSLLYRSPYIKIGSNSDQWSSFYTTVMKTSAGSLIKELCIKRMNLYDGQRSPVEKALSVISRCTNLEDLKLRDIPLFPASIVRAAPNIRHLLLDIHPRAELSSPREVKITCLQSMLETLTLTQDTVGLVVNGPTLPFLPHFRHFRCRSIDISLPDRTDSSTVDLSLPHAQPQTWIELLSAPSNHVRMNPRMLVRSRMMCGTHRGRDEPREKNPSNYHYDMAKEFFDVFPDVRVNHLHLEEVEFVEPILEFFLWELPALKKVELLTITWGHDLAYELDCEERKAKMLESLGRECERCGIRFGGVTAGPEGELI